MKHRVGLQLENSVSSPQDLQALQTEIREYARWFNHNAIKKRLNAASATKPPELSSGASALLRQWSSEQSLTQKRLDALLRALADFADQAPLLTVTLAAPAGGSLKRTITDWCRANIAPNILVNYEFNSTLLGGLVVRYGSRIFDWSFRQQILAARGNFPKVLRDVR